jgi:hypothetical protein
MAVSSHGSVLNQCYCKTVINTIWLKKVSSSAAVRKPFVPALQTTVVENCCRNVKMCYVSYLSVYAEGPGRMFCVKNRFYTVKAGSGSSQLGGEVP